jgi:hypothetical protein
MGIWDYTAEQRGTPQPAPQLAPQPAAAPQSWGGSDNRDDNRAWTQARGEQMAGAPWGGFGSYGNWANQYASEHGGRTPNQADEADFWDSQIYAAQHGEGPDWGQWRNRWETGNWDVGMPWQLRYPGPGRKYYGEPFTNMRGSAMSSAFMNALANPYRAPYEIRPGFISWLNMRNQLPGLAQPMAAPRQQAVAAWQPPSGWPAPGYANAVRQAPSWAQATYLPQMYGR